MSVRGKTKTRSICAVCETWQPLHDGTKTIHCHLPPINAPTTLIVAGLIASRKSGGPDH
jgi:hypothetical protein